MPNSPGIEWKVALLAFKMAEIHCWISVTNFSRYLEVQDIYLNFCTFVHVQVFFHIYSFSGKSKNVGKFWKAKNDNFYSYTIKKARNGSLIESPPSSASLGENLLVLHVIRTVLLTILAQRTPVFDRNRWNMKSLWRHLRRIYRPSPQKKNPFGQDVRYWLFTYCGHLLSF